MAPAEWRRPLERPPNNTDDAALFGFNFWQSFFLLSLCETNLHAIEGRGRINIYDCRFEKSNNARTFAEIMEAIQFVSVLPLRKSQFLQWPSCDFQPLRCWILARNLHIFRNVFVADEKRQQYALKLRFQRQNNRSLWPMLSNRFGFLPSLNM